MSIEDPIQREWPIKTLALAWVFALCTLAVFSPTLDGRAGSAARVQAQLAVILLILARILFAKLRKEVSAGWLFWTIFLYAALPLWLAFEMVAFPLLNSFTQTTP